MLDAARLAVETTERFTLDDILPDEIRVLGLEKCVEIVGEAAYRISRNYKDDHPAIPWQIIVRLRNHLVHDYAAIDFELIWRNIREDFPALISDLEQILESG